MFSVENNTRHYKVSIKGSQGTLTFTELVKRSFVTEILIKNLRKAGIEESMHQEIDMDRTWIVDEPKRLIFFQKMYSDYINQVRKKLLKKNISIVNYQLRKITIKPFDEKALQVESELYIEVTV